MRTAAVGAAAALWFYIDPQIYVQLPKLLV